MIKIFLDICETTISQLQDEPTPQEIKEKTQILINLFKEMPNKSSSIIVLWGELFLIASSKNTFPLGADTPRGRMSRKLIA